MARTVQKPVPMAVIESILARAGYVKLSRYGMMLTPDGRIVDLHAMTSDVPFAAPVPGPTVAPIAPPAPPPPAPAPRVAAPVAPVATPVAPRSASMPSVIISADVLPDDGDDGLADDDEWEWQLALARARIAAAETEAAKMPAPAIRALPNATVARRAAPPATPPHRSAAAPIVRPAPAPIARPAAAPIARPAAEPARVRRTTSAGAAVAPPARPIAAAPTPARPIAVTPPTRPIAAAPPPARLQPPPLPPPPVVAQPAPLPVTPLPPSPPRRFARGTGPLVPAQVPAARPAADLPPARVMSDDTSEITTDVTDLGVGDVTSVDVARPVVPPLPRAPLPRTPAALPRLSARR